MRQFVEKSPLFAPGVVDELDEFGRFVTRWYKGEQYDQNGDRRY